MVVENKEDENITNVNKNNKITLGSIFKPNIKRTASKAIQNFELDVQIANDIKTKFKKVFSKEENAKINSQSNNPKERFADGLKQFNVSEDELKERISTSNKIFNFLIVMTAIILSVVILSFSSNHSVLSKIMYLAPSIALIVMMISLLLKWGFYNYCLRNRTTYKFVDWLKQPSEWLTSNKISKSIKIIAFLGFLLSSSVVGSHSSFAADNSLQSLTTSGSTSKSCTNSDGSYVTDTFSLPCNDDIYKNLLESIFPNVPPLGNPTILSSNSNSINGSAALANSFQAFLSVLMSISMALLSFHIISSLVSVAHEGSMLKGKWSYVWSPIRIFLGTGCLTPFIKGYCIAQVVVLYVALWGGSLANVMWASYVDGLTSPSIGYSAMPNLQSPVEKMTESMACWASLNASKSGLDDIQTVPPQFEYYKKSQSGAWVGVFSYINKFTSYMTGNYNNSNSYNTQVVNEWVANFGDNCGSYTMFVPASGDSSGYGTYGTKTKDAMNTYLKAIGKTMQNYTHAAILQNQSDTQLTAEQINNISSEITSSYNTFIGSWGLAMKDFTDALNNSGDSKSAINSFIDSSKRYGWATAGTYYMTLSRMQGLANDIMFISSPRPRTNNFLGKNSDSEAKLLTTDLSKDTYKTLLEQTLASFNNEQGSTVKDVENNLSDGASAGAISGVSVNTNTTMLTNPENAYTKITSSMGSAMSQILNSFFNSVGADSSSDSKDVGGSELQKMMEFGQNLIALTMIIMTGAAVAAAGAVVFSFTPAGKGVAMATGGGGGLIGKMAGVAIGVALLGVGCIFITGILHAYILPMMPYIHFMLFVMSMIIFVVEAMIAAPLWAFIHIRLNGQELIEGEQRQGYMLVFNLFLRAPLGMFGLFLSLTIFNIMIFFLKLTFYPAVSAGLQMGQDTSASLNSQMGFVGTLVMVIMMSYLHFIIAMRSFELISDLPNRVTKWFGANGINVEGEGRLGDSLKSFMTGSVAGQMSRSAGNIVQGALKGGGQRQYAKQDDATTTPITSSKPGGVNVGGGSGGAGLGGKLSGGMSGKGSSGGAGLGGKLSGGGYSGGNTGVYDKKESGFSSGLDSASKFGENASDKVGNIEKTVSGNINKASENSSGQSNQNHQTEISKSNTHKSSNKPNDEEE